MIYASQVHWSDRARLPAHGPAARRPQLDPQPQDQGRPEADRRGDHRARRSHHRVAAQHRAGEESRPRAAGDRAAQRHHRKILKLELKKVRYLRSLSFVQGTCVNLLRTSILFLMLYLIFTQQITVGQFFSLFIYSFFIFGPLQELGNVINVYRETEVSLAELRRDPQAAARAAPRASRAASTRSTPSRFDDVTFQHQSASTPALTDISFPRRAAARPSRSSALGRRARPRS